MDMATVSARIDQLVKEGTNGKTVRDTRPNKAHNLEGRMQAELFSEIREDMNTYASSRIMSVGKNDSADQLFKELFG